ncbi:hypothetical protein OSTOST_08861 [Ostertagia ostertagi]
MRHARGGHLISIGQYDVHLLRNSMDCWWIRIEIFYDGFMGLRNASMREAQRKISRVTGHSLGAAMASRAASSIIADNQVPSSRVKLVTLDNHELLTIITRGSMIYGYLWSQRAVNLSGQFLLRSFGNLDADTGRPPSLRKHERRNFRMAYGLRVTYWRDVVSHISPEYFLHYYHHASEAFYPLNMTVGVNYTSDDCSDGLLDTTSIQDHLYYFNVDVSAYGINGCNTTMDPTNAQ